jgi:hypothetical protein
MKILQVTPAKGGEVSTVRGHCGLNCSREATENRIGGKKKKKTLEFLFKGSQWGI